MVIKGNIQKVPFVISGSYGDTKEAHKDAWVYAGATPGTFVARIRPNSLLEQSIAKNVHLKVRDPADR